MGRADVLMEAYEKIACGHFRDNLEFGTCDRIGRTDLETVGVKFAPHFYSYFT